MAATLSADEIFHEFKEHSIAEFFRKNSQMLGYSGKVRSLTTIVHEYVTNSLDAVEEAGVLPDIRVDIKEIGESRYTVCVSDNGPGIPSKHVGKVFATVLAGTKFHRYVQQRGQQGIGAAGCTLFSRITTGKPVHVKSATSKERYECDIDIDIKSNKPLVKNMATILAGGVAGTTVCGEFAEVKYENSDHGVYEYIKRTALSNPHASITLVEPTGKEVVFLRSVTELPKRPKAIKPHPLGIDVNDFVEFAHRSQSRKLSAFLVEAFSRMTSGKIAELKDVSHDIDLDADPTKITWSDAERVVKAFKQIKWMAPELDSLSTIGEKQIEIAIKNILAPKFMSVVERKPKVFRGGIPFVVEAGIAYGGESGKKVDENAKDGSVVEAEGNVLRFANKVPLLFDASNCAITEAVKGIQWKRYGIANFEEEPVSIFVNVSSVYVPYSGPGKQAVAKEDDIIEEIRLAVMDCGRILQRYLSGVRSLQLQESRYKTIMRYVEQLSKDLGEITGVDSKTLEASLKSTIEKKYNKLFADPEKEDASIAEEESETEEAEG
ncbi:MAG: DNA topoisomerase VI subunit B [Candidatus Marsarchaeota archaeon]|jgi:DNA topoisomerase-6 subunit B|nr:DNA topoisomerase VI subunit B [Candidatus Marsarchaeota archaeon]